MSVYVRDLHAKYLVTRYVIARQEDDLIKFELERYENLLKKGGGKELEKVALDYQRYGQFPIHALNGVNLEIKEKAITGVVGESGSGKSTLALLLLGLKHENLVVDRGEIVFKNKNILELNEEELRNLRAKHMGYIGQGTQTYLNPLMTNAFQIFESSLVKTSSLDKALDMFRRAIDEVGVDKRILTTLPKKLSGGQLRKISIAMALAKEPEFLVADEPFRNLDTYHAYSMAILLKELTEKLKMTTVIFTHNLSLLAQIADYIAVMYQGIILEYGPTEEIFKKPKHPYTKGLIGAIPDPREPKKKLVYIPGEPMPRIIKPNFCPFYNRCPARTEECLSRLPPEEKIGGSTVLCFRAKELADIPPQEFWGEE